MSIISGIRESGSLVGNFYYGATLYVALGTVAAWTIVFTEAEISPAYILSGALAGGAFLIVRHVLDTRPLVRRVYDILIFALMFVFATRDVTGKLAIVTGACISLSVVSYWLHIYRD